MTEVHGDGVGGGGGVVVVVVAVIHGKGAGCGAICGLGPLVACRKLATGSSNANSHH